MYAPFKRALVIFPRHIVFWVILPGLLLALLGSYTAYRMQEETVLAETARALDATSNAVEQRFRARVISVQAVRADMLSSPSMDQAEFDEFVSFFYETVTGFQSLQYVDAQNIVRYVFPAIGENRRAINFDNSPFPNRMEPIERAKASNQPVITEPIQLIQGFPGVIIYVPIFQGTTYKGQAVGVLKLTDLFETARSRVDLGLYDVIVESANTCMSLQGSKIYTSDGEEIVSPKGTTGTPGKMQVQPTRYTQSKIVRMADQDWTVRVSPKRAVYHHVATNSLLVGLVVSLCILLLALLVEYLQRLKHEREEALHNQTEIISLLAHQLRTPITQINWLLEAIENAKTTKEREAMTDDLRLINGNNKRLIDNLLSLSRIQRGVLSIDPQDVRLKDVVRDAVSTLGALAEDRHITINVKRGLDALIHADPVKAPEAIRNIVDNAIKYSPEKTTITIDLDPKSSEQHAVLRISDQGPGIPKHLQGIVFEQSTLSKDKSHENAGAGLGLYLTRKFLRMMDGDVRFETTDRGTTFYVQFKKIG